MSGFTIFIMVDAILLGVGGLFFLIIGIAGSDISSSELNIPSAIGSVCVVISIFLWGVLKQEMKKPEDLQKQYEVRQKKIEKAERELQIWLIKHPEFKVVEE